MPIDEAAKSLRLARRNAREQTRLVFVLLGSGPGSGPDPLLRASTPMPRKLQYSSPTLSLLQTPNRSDQKDFLGHAGVTPGTGVNRG